MSECRYKRYAEKHPMRLLLKSIKQRCNNKSHTSYKNYGAKGIKCLITEEDLIFLWDRDNGYLLKRPSIDRVDSKGDYRLDNCRFIELSDNVKRATIKPLINGNKICMLCKKQKASSLFRKDKKVFSGLRSKCVECEKIYQDSFKKKNPGYSKSWYLSNRDRVLKTSADYYSKNREKILLRMKNKKLEVVSF